MTEPRRGLTWSKRWHIVDETKSNPRYDMALCGAYLYNAEKEKACFRGNRMPEHLQRIIDGTAKSAGDCKLCNKSAGRKSLSDLLVDEKMADQIGKLIFKRTQLVDMDASDLAWDIMALITKEASS
jgi:hypothetical protein